MEQPQRVVHVFDEQTKAPEWYLSATMQEGADLRLLFEYLRQGASNATFTFDASGISCGCSTDGNFVYNTFSFKAHNLPKYSFWSEDGKPVTVSVEMEQWKEALNGTAKKEDLEILKKREDPAIYVRPSGADDDRFSYVSPLLKQQLCTYELPEIQDKHNPACRVTGQKFSRMCSTLGKGKSKSVDVTRHLKGLTFTHKVAGRSAGQVFYFGDDRSAEEDYTAKDSMLVSREIVKSLNKVGSIAGKAVICIYYTPNALKIRTRAAAYGSLEIYIRRCDPSGKA